MARKEALVVLELSKRRVRFLPLRNDPLKRRSCGMESRELIARSVKEPLQLDRPGLRFRLDDEAKYRGPVSVKQPRQALEVRTHSEIPRVDHDTVVLSIQY